MTRHDCGTEHTTAASEARCTYEATVRAALTAHAARLDQPPTDAQTLDLWAHARRHGDDGTDAARWVRIVLELGWRPAVGGGA